MIKGLKQASGYQSHYIPNTEEERSEMLDAIGVESIDELFADIPEELRNPTLDIPEPMSELELRREVENLAAQNRNLRQLTSFLGAGAYNHFSPSIVRAIITRGEFLTAYTPYQPEVSQGTLQATYDFQTLICNLFAMEVADAGMYDGPTSFAEAALMACRVTERGRVAVLDTTSPTYRQVLDTYTQAQGIETVAVDPQISRMPDDTACLIVQRPNFLGYVEGLAHLEQVVHGNGALLVVSANPVAAALFRPPGDFNADIVTGEGQALGIPPSFGGPYVGLFSSRQRYVRQMPGRIVGKTADSEGRTGYVLTLSTREQHIRRERATSNICTNQALMTLATTVYMAALGKQGLRQVAELSYHKAHYAASLIAQIPRFSFPYQGTFFNEFTVRCPVDPAEINKKLLERGIIGGFDASDLIANAMILCATEMNTREEIEALAATLSEFS